MFSGKQICNRGDNHGYGDWLKSDQNLESNNIHKVFLIKTLIENLIK